MGFFSKLKKKMTGSWADVSVELPEEIARGSEVTATIRVKVKDEPVEVDKIVLALRCSEEIRIPRHTVHANGESVTVDVRHNENLYKEEVDVTGSLQLGAHDHRTFDVPVKVPVDAPVSFEGICARYVWQVYAALEMSGNDPDSGWTEVVVS